MSVENQLKAEPGSGDTADQTTNGVAAEPPVDQSELERLSENEADTVITCLEEVLLVLKNASQIIVSEKPMISLR